MTTPVSSRPSDKQYMGNSYPGHLEVHDLANENANCQIDEIIEAGNAVVFSPDTLKQAHDEAYDDCSWCLSGSLR